jgi:hypothetical protein
MKEGKLRKICCAVGRKQKVEGEGDAESIIEDGEREVEGWGRLGKAGN